MVQVLVMLALVLVTRGDPDCTCPDVPTYSDPLNVINVQSGNVNEIIQF